MSPTVLFIPTVSYYPPASVSKISTCALPRIDEGKPLRSLDYETLAYADESFDKTDEEKMVTALIDYKSLESSNLLDNAKEKRLRFAAPISEIDETDLLLENCSNCVSCCFINQFIRCLSQM